MLSSEDNFLFHDWAFLLFCIFLIFDTMSFNCSFNLLESWLTMALSLLFPFIFSFVSFVPSFLPVNSYLTSIYISWNIISRYALKFLKPMINSCHHFFYTFSWCIMLLFVILSSMFIISLTIRTIINIIFLLTAIFSNFDIWEGLRDLVTFTQFEKREKHSWRIDTFSKVAGFSHDKPGS